MSPLGRPGGEDRSAQHEGTRAGLPTGQPPDAMAGLYGKLPAHGDFVRRGLPLAFVQPWDAWLQASLAAARSAAGEGFDALWRAAPVWRFLLPAGVCGHSAVTGVLVPSRDAVGRDFPLTLAVLLPAAPAAASAGWYDALEAIAVQARDQTLTADALLAMLPQGQAAAPGPADVDGNGWWRPEGPHWAFGTLPPPGHFQQLLLPAPGAMASPAAFAGNPASDESGAAALAAVPPPSPPPLARLAPVSAAATHQGTVRKRNEDAVVERPDIGLWAVADGAGGHGAGDVASSAVAAALADLPPGLSGSEVLAQVRLRLGAVHAELQQRETTHPGAGLAATTAVVLLVRDTHFACLWVGDSRAYLLRDGVLRQLTRDHSLVQELVETGELAAEDAESHPQANVITRAVGAADALLLDKVAGTLLPGDLMLLCTDGLFKALPEASIANLLATGGGAQGLIDAALAAAARDNVSAVVISF